MQEAALSRIPISEAPLRYGNKIRTRRENREINMRLTYICVRLFLFFVFVFIVFSTLHPGRVSRRGFYDRRRFISHNKFAHTGRPLRVGILFYARLVRYFSETFRFYILLLVCCFHSKFSCMLNTRLLIL